MALPDIINSIEEHIRDVYHVIESKGGTLPQNHNLENLAEAIKTVSGEVDYGSVIIRLEDGSEKEFKLDMVNFMELSGQFASKTYLTFDGQDYEKETIVAYDTGDKCDFLWPYMLGNSDNMMHGDEFLRLESLRSIRIGKKIKELPNGFLSRGKVHSLEVLDLGKIEKIGDNFLKSSEGWDSAKVSLTIPDSVVSIGDYFLSGTWTFNQKITIPDSVVSIGRSFMSGCSALEELPILPKSLKRIPDNSFGSCSALKRIEFPEGIEELGENVFEWTSGFEGSVVLPSTLKKMGEGCFYYIRNFTGPLEVHCDVPEGAEYSFLAVSESKTWEEGITVTGPKAEEWINNLPVKAGEGGASSYDNMFRWLVGQDKPTPYAEYQTSSSSSPYAIYDIATVEGVTSGDSVWPQGSGIIKIKFYPRVSELNITTLRKWWPSRESFIMSKLESIEGLEYLDKVTALPLMGLAQLSSLKEFVIPAHMTVARDLCQRCTSLQRLVLGENLAKLDTYTCYGCTNLKEIVMNYTGSLDGYSTTSMFNTLSSSCSAYVNGVKVTGPGAAALVEKYPPEGSPSYRKLVLGN